jgi:hypothetical protein
MKKFLFLFYALGISGFTGVKENCLLDIDIGGRFIHSLDPALEYSITILPKAINKAHKNHYVTGLVWPVDSTLIVDAHEKKYPHLIHTHNMPEGDMLNIYLYPKSSKRKGLRKGHHFPEMPISDPSDLPLLPGRNIPG